jgi:hypothetical protein
MLVKLLVPVLPVILVVPVVIWSIVRKAKAFPRGESLGERIHLSILVARLSVLLMELLDAIHMLLVLLFILPKFHPESLRYRTPALDLIRLHNVEMTQKYR